MNYSLRPIGKLFHSRARSRLLLYWLIISIFTLVLPAIGQEVQNEMSSQATTENTAIIPKKRILFIGDSLTDGFGISREQSYPSLIAENIKRENLPYSVQNAGVSGDTTAGGLRRTSWLLGHRLSRNGLSREGSLSDGGVGVIVLALGANDGLRGLPPEKTEENLLGIIGKARESNPQIRVLLAGMLVPPNMGPEYEQAFRAIFPSVAKQADVELLPFLLQGVAARPELNIADGFHPNEEGHKIIAASVWRLLRPLLVDTGAK